MKKTSFYILALSLVCAFFSCEETIPFGTDPATDTEMLTDTGPWRVSYFFDKDKEETSDFDGYEFYFEANSEFRAILPNGSVFKGQWSRTTDDNLPRLVIQITGNDDLDELQDDWVLKLLEDKKIELEDDNTTEVEQLHFSR